MKKGAEQLNFISFGLSPFSQLTLANTAKFSLTSRNALLCDAVVSCAGNEPIEIFNYLQIFIVEITLWADFRVARPTKAATMVS